MEKENERLQDAVEVEEELDTDVTTEDTESAEEVSDEVTLSKSEFKKLQRRALAYEALKKDGGETITKTTKPTEDTDDTFKEELKFLAKGYSDDAIEYLKVLSRGAGVTMKEAEENPLFQAFQEKQDAERKAKRAQLGASRGSATKKAVDMSKMTPEEHQKAWYEMVSKLGQ